MSLLNLSFIVLLGILIFVSYFHFSNSFLDNYNRKSNVRFKFENSIRVVIFILPAFIVLFIFILYPVFETVRLSFYDKFGREFVGLYNYKWAVDDPEFRRSILNNFGWLLIVVGSIFHHVFDDFSMCFASLFRDHFLMIFFCLFRIDF